MIILSLDFETTGLDVAGDEVIEYGLVLWSTGQHRIMRSESGLVRASILLSAEVTGLTGITQAAVDKFGIYSASALDKIYDFSAQADALAGQNIIRFDNRVLTHLAGRHKAFQPTLSKKPIIDTLYDIPGVEGKKLQYMLADHGKLNPFPHSALTDALSVIVLIEEHTALDGNIDPILERARSPFVILQSLHPRNENDQAKKQPFRFRWNPDRKIWWKALKEIDVEEFRKSYQFETTVRTDLTLDDLETD